MSQPIRVASIGPGLSVPGGMSRVIQLIISYLPQHIEMRHIPTFTRYTGDREATSAARGSRIVQGLVYARALTSILSLALNRKTIFHVHFSGRGSLLRKGIICVVLRLMRCRYIVHSHAAGTDLFHPWVPAPCRQMILWGLNSADHVIVLTRFWYDYYFSLLEPSAGRLLLLPNPAVLPAALPKRSPTGRLRLLFLGRVGRRKGAFDLIRAFANLPDDLRSICHLTLAGDGETDAARRLATELKCSDQISVLGWVGPREVDNLLSASDALVLPSHAEGMAMALVEGMSWELAVVTTSAGGTGDFLEDGENCLLVTPGEVQQISNAIARLALNPALTQHLGRAAGQTVARYCIGNYINTLSKLYEELACGLPRDSSAVERGLGATQLQIPTSYPSESPASSSTLLEASFKE